MFAVVGAFPLVYTAYVSVHDWSLLGGKGDFVGLAELPRRLGNPYFAKQLVNTLSIFVLSSVPQVIVGGRARRPARQPAARTHLVADEHPAARSWCPRSPWPSSSAASSVTATACSTSCSAPSGIGPIAWHTDRLASHLAIATMVNWRWTGYNALIFLAAMQAVPRDLYESAARSTGPAASASSCRITLPMIRPTMIFVIITSTIGGLQIFAEPRLFDETTARNGGSDRQFGTITMLDLRLRLAAARPRPRLGDGLDALRADHA